MSKIRRPADKRLVGVLRRCSCADDARDCKHWSYALEVPGLDGKRRQLSGGGYSSAKAAAAARRVVLRKHDDGALADDQKLTVGQWLDRWLELRESDPETALRPSTLLAYTQHTRDFFKPKLGGLRLRDLRRDHVSTMLSEIVADRNAAIENAHKRNAAWEAKNGTPGPVRIPRPLSVASVRRIRASLSSALGDAAEQGLLASNPAVGLKVRKGKKRQNTTREIKAWNAEQVARFLDATVADPLGPFWHLAALHGLRRGELCGLRWSSLDLDAGTLAVEHTRTSVNYQVHDGDPKSEYSRATITLDAASAQLLRGHRVHQAQQRLFLGKAWQGGDLVFVREDGEPWHPDRVSKLFVAAVKRHGLPKISLHGLRHTSASLQLDNGIGIEIVSKRLRHANVTITSGVYSHLVGDAGRQAADAVADAVAKHRKTV